MNGCIDMFGNPVFVGDKVATLYKTYGLISQDFIVTEIIPVENNTYNLKLRKTYKNLQYTGKREITRPDYTCIVTLNRTQLIRDLVEIKSQLEQLTEAFNKINNGRKN